MLRCGCCGGGFSKISKLMFGCSTSRNKGESICANRRNIRQDELEITVLATLTRHLMDPELVKVFCEEYTAHINRLRMEHNASLHSYQAELKKIDRLERRIIEAVKEGYTSEAMKNEFNAFGERRKELTELLIEKNPEPVLLHPNMALRYRKEVTALVDALNHDERRDEAAELIRSLVERIVLTPDPNGKGLLVDLNGDLAGILNIATKADRAKNAQQLDLKRIRMVVGMDFAAAADLQGKAVGLAPPHLEGVRDKMVGPAGLEPATRPL
ncbi:zinc ribbon domain-containing protein [Methylobacterium sp. Leaf456]|uniref:zinc ribbon domain-containing protein n=1 Tax=Methylobacterium sp. Leaf456 TaxID=1736382 RepID=UPI0012E33664